MRCARAQHGHGTLQPAQRVAAVNGGSVRVVSAAGGFDDTYRMPKSGWSCIGKLSDGKGYRYKDLKLVNGRVKRATLKKNVFRCRARAPGSATPSARTPTRCP
jgi:hypothetical protein